MGNLSCSFYSLLGVSALLESVISGCIMLVTHTCTVLVEETLHHLALQCPIRANRELPDDATEKGKESVLLTAVETPETQTAMARFLKLPKNDKDNSPILEENKSQLRITLGPSPGWTKTCRLWKGTFSWGWASSASSEVFQRKAGPRKWSLLL